MKIKPQHYSIIKDSINQFMESHKGLLEQHYQDIKINNKAKDIDKRFRWDIIHGAGLTQFICKELYPYLNDDHIDTALRRVMREANEWN